MANEENKKKQKWILTMDRIKEIQVHIKHIYMIHLFSVKCESKKKSLYSIYEKCQKTWKPQQKKNVLDIILSKKNTEK